MNVTGRKGKVFRVRKKKNSSVVERKVCWNNAGRLQTQDITRQTKHGHTGTRHVVNKTCDDLYLWSLFEGGGGGYLLAVLHFRGWIRQSVTVMVVVVVVNNSNHDEEPNGGEWMTYSDHRRSGYKWGDSLQGLTISIDVDLFEISWYLTMEMWLNSWVVGGNRVHLIIQVGQFFLFSNLINQVTSIHVTYEHYDDEDVLSGVLVEL